ncbi:MAG: hypothetical protein ABJE95_31815 [Byssovorax sp.]
MNRSLPDRAAPFLFLAATLGACARQHDLGISTSSGAGGSGGESATVTGATGATSATGSSSSGESSTTGAGSGGAEPVGPTRVTLVNGVNDYDAIRVCFVPYPAGGATKIWPAAAPGLPFAHGAVLDLAVDIPSGTDVQPVIFAGDLTQIAGKTCAEADALAVDSGSDAGPPPPIVRAALAVLPAQVFTSGKSLLLAPIGCMGGPGHEGPSAALACGFSYSPTTPTVDLIALGMSRKTEPNHVALQIVNAAVALQPTDIGITSSIQQSMSVPLATALPTGGIEPKPPFIKYTLNEYGPLDTVSLKTYLPGQGTMFVTSDTPLGEAFFNGTVSSLQIQNGGGYVLVAVGSYPNIPAGAFWHKLTYSIVKANP